MYPRCAYIMSLFTTIKRRDVPMHASMARMFGVDFGPVEHVLFAVVKGTTMDLIYAVNRVLLPFIPN